jgi:hypothetical protein
VNRRNFLRGAGVCLAVPALEAFGAASQKAQPVRRFVAVGNPFGFFPDAFFPEQTGTNYQLPLLLKPLARHRKRFTVFSHLDHDLSGGHDACHCFLSGIKVGEGKHHPEGNISLDQKMADWVGARTRFPSLHLGNGANQSWTRNGIQVRSEADPKRVFDAMFLDDSVDARKAWRLRMGLDGSVLDAVREQAKGFSRKLGARDRQKLDQYFTAVRELERKLRMNAQWIDRPKPKINAKRPEKGEGQKENLPLYYELIALALQTDSTRVATAWANGGNLLEDFGLSFPSYHKYSHHGRLPELVEGLLKIELHQMECLAVFLDRLKSAEDDLNGGNLLDHTTVLVGSGLANGSSHSTRDMPILVAGGGFKHGTHKKYLEQSGKRVPLNNLYLNLLHRFGVETDRFNTSTGSLTNFS